MEGSVQVFAGDFNTSTLQLEQDPGSQLWIVTPSGAWCRSVFLAGALTEVTENGDMMYCRLADPTGAFDLFAGGRTSDIANFLRSLPVPSFVTVTGRARFYRKAESVYLSVRIDNIRVVDRSVRDQWVLDTACRMLIRLELIKDASGETTSDHKIIAAIRHYHPDLEKLDALASMLEDAIRCVSPRGIPQEIDVKAFILELLGTATDKRGISVEEIIAKASDKGIPQDAILKTLEALIVDDECYQPQKGFVKQL